MRAVLQRVVSASIEVEGRIVSSIGPGLLCFIGIKDTDTMLDADYIRNKILNMRLFHTKSLNKPWSSNVVKMGYEILIVSQFTLFARVKKSRPNFSKAMAPEQARYIYDEFVDTMRKSYHAWSVKDGVFGAKMKVKSENDGPVTIILDSSKMARDTGDMDDSDAEEEIVQDDNSIQIQNGSN